MLVAARTAHAGKGPWVTGGGWEYVLTIAAVAIGLAFNGAGAWSLDGAIGWDVSGLSWGVGAALVALLAANGVLGRATAGGPCPRAPSRSAPPSPEPASDEEVPEMSNAIEANGLVKTYPGDIRALDGLSFAAEEGT